MDDSRSRFREDGMIEIDANDNHLIKNVSILDAKSYHMLFQRVYKWNETEGFSNLPKLIQSFYQLARDVDTGEVTSVNFETGITYAPRKLNNFDPQASTGKKTMQMLTLRSKEIIISLFFDMQGLLTPTNEDKQKLLVLLHSIKAAFYKKYFNDNQHSRQKFVDILQSLTTSQSTEDSFDVSSQPISYFDDFNEIVDKLRNQTFPVYPLDVNNRYQHDYFINNLNLSLEEHVAQQMIQIDDIGSLHVGLTNSKSNDEVFHI
eukprot:gene7860-10669_t